MSTLQKSRSIEQWKKDFPDWADVIDGTKFGAYSLAGLDLPENFYLPEELTEIGQNAFSRCVFMGNNFDFPSTLKVLGTGVFQDAVFKGTNLDWTIPSGVKELPADCFSRFNIKGSLTLSEGLKVIRVGALSGLTLDLKSTPWTLPNSLENIEDDAFKGSFYIFNGKRYGMPVEGDVESIRLFFQDPEDY